MFQQIHTHSSGTIVYVTFFPVLPLRTVYMILLELILSKFFVAFLNKKLILSAKNILVGRTLVSCTTVISWRSFLYIGRISLVRKTRTTPLVLFDSFWIIKIFIIWTFFTVSYRRVSCIQKIFTLHHLKNVNVLSPFHSII